MKSLFVITTLFAFAFSLDPVPCTDSIKDLVDDVFEMVIDIEKDGFGMHSQSVKDVLKGVTEILNTCAGSDVDLSKYDSCVDGVMPTMPMVKKLITDIKSGQTNNILLDVSQIGLQLANGITTCIQQPHAVEEYLL